MHFERWRHAYGCGKWFLAARDTATLQVFATYKAQNSHPPAEVVAAIQVRAPGLAASTGPGTPPNDVRKRRPARHAERHAECPLTKAQHDPDRTLLPALGRSP